MDELRARAYLDLLLDTDSRPAAPAAESQAGPAAEQAGRLDTDSRPASGSPAAEGPAGPAPPAPPGSGVRPAGYTGRTHLTVPLATLLDLAGRPGEIPGLGPVDPDPGANT